MNKKKWVKPENFIACLCCFLLLLSCYFIFLTGRSNARAIESLDKVIMIIEARRLDKK